MSSLNAYIAEGEHKLQEFKESYSRTMLKTISAFANYHDGRIIIGVTDIGKTVGVRNAAQIRINIENAINDSIRPRPHYDTTVYHEGHMDVLVYTVYKGDRTPYTYNRKAFERNDTSTVEVDRESYDELVLLGKNLTFEALPYKGSLEFSLLSEKLSESLSIPTTDLNVLKSLGLYRNDSWNNAAAVIADVCPFDDVGLNLIVYKDYSMTVVEDRCSLASVSVLKHLDECMKFYNNYIRQKDIIQGERRHTYKEVPSVAYREAVINAIVHRDYRKRASNRIEFFPDRIEILSVGGLPVGTTEEEYITGSYSNLRNPIIADLFYRLGYVEKMGTGIRRIKQSYADYDAEPVLKVMKNSILIILPLILESSFDEPTTILGEDNLSLELDKMYAYIQVEGKVSRQNVEDYMGVRKTKAVKLLNELADKKLINKVGTGRTVSYEWNR